MTVLIKCVGAAGLVIMLDGSKSRPEGKFLAEFDPEFAEGRGLAKWTADWRKAMAFDSMGPAFELWRAIPASRPVRDDGKPNRPLTAFSVTFVDAPEVPRA